MLREDFLIGHPVSHHRNNGCDREPEATDTGYASHLGWVCGDPGGGRLSKLLQCGRLAPDIRGRPGEAFDTRRSCSLDDSLGAPIRTLAMDQSDWARHGTSMDETLIGYAHCSTDEQDLTAQRQALHALGVRPARVYIDHGSNGTKRERPGLDPALAAVRTGDTLVVPKLDRLARPVPDARWGSCSSTSSLRSLHRTPGVAREYRVPDLGKVVRSK